jgi:hypothetical protein
VAAKGETVELDLRVPNPNLAPCRVVRILPVGNLPHHLVIGEIVHLHVRDDVYDAATGRIDMRRLRPGGRLAGHQYTHVHDIFEMKCPAAEYRG